MTIKEVEEELNIPRATVRFYEKERLLSPERGENGYRDYCEQDIVKLKKIITLRKIGISVQSIEDIFDGVKDINEVVSDNLLKLQEQLDELNGAIRLSKIINSRNESIEKFDEEYYWNLVLEEEKHGNRFMEIVDGIAKYEKHIFLKQFNLEDSEGELRTSKANAVKVVLIGLFFGGLFYMIVDGLINKEFSFESFKIGAVMPFIWIAVASAFGLAFRS